MSDEKNRPRRPRTRRQGPRRQGRDYYSGLPWVDIDPGQARSLPKGRLGVALWGIAAYFVAVGLLKLVLVLGAGGGFWAMLIHGIWPLLTGLGLALRMPWAVIMAVLVTGLTVFSLVTGMVAINVNSVGNLDATILFFEVVINACILFYLIDGDRPNLIYRHRYRQYSLNDED